MRGVCPGPRSRSSRGRPHAARPSAFRASRPSLPSVSVTGCRAVAEARLIDGKAFAAALRARDGKGVANLLASKGIKPGLATVLVGDDPASQVYVKSKSRVAA